MRGYINNNCNLKRWHHSIPLAVLCVKRRSHSNQSQIVQMRWVRPDYKCSTNLIRSKKPRNLIQKRSTIKFTRRTKWSSTWRVNSKIAWRSKRLCSNKRRSWRRTMKSWRNLASSGRLLQTSCKRSYWNRMISRLIRELSTWQTICQRSRIS